MLIGLLIGFGLGVLLARLLACLVLWIAWRREQRIHIHKERREMWIARDRHDGEAGHR